MDKCYCGIYGPGKNPLWKFDLGQYFGRLPHCSGAVLSFWHHTYTCVREMAEIEPQGRVDRKDSPTNMHTGGSAEDSKLGKVVPVLVV